MKIINFFNFDFILLKKYYKYFLLGKEINIINEMEEIIIKYLHTTNHFIQIFRVDLNLQLNIYELHKTFSTNIFDSINLVILNAEEIWLHSAPIKNILLLLHKVFPKNYYLIVKSHFTQQTFTNKLFMDDKIFLFINPLIINCKINNDLNEFKYWLGLRTKSLNLKISPFINKYLYKYYYSDLDNLSQIINTITTNNNPRIKFCNLKKMFVLYDKLFTIKHFFKYLSQGNLYLIWYKLMQFQLYKEDEFINLFYNLKSCFFKFTKQLLNYKNKHINYKPYYLHKISMLLNLKKLYLINKLLNKLEFDMVDLNLSNKDKCNLILYKIIHITIMIYKPLFYRSLAH